MPGLKERAKTLVELLDGAQFLFADAAARRWTTKATRDPRRRRARRISRRCCRCSRGLDDWSAARTEAAVRAYAETSGHQARAGGAAAARRADRAARPRRASSTCWRCWGARKASAASPIRPSGLAA